MGIIESDREVARIEALEFSIRYSRLIRDLDLRKVIDDINFNYGGRIWGDNSDPKADVRQYALYKIKTEDGLPGAVIWKKALSAFDRGESMPLANQLRDEAISLIRDNFTESRRLGGSLIGLTASMLKRDSEIDFSALLNQVV